MISGVAKPAHVEAATKSIASRPLAKDQGVAISSKLAETQPETLRLAEEQLDIGKQRIETGRTRVRRFTTERDVDQNVTLHDEHGEVLRRAVSQPAALRRQQAEVERLDASGNAIRQPGAQQKPPMQPRA